MHEENLLSTVLLALSEALRHAAQGLSTPTAQPVKDKVCTQNVSLRQALDDFLASKQARGCKPRYLVALRSTLGTLARSAPGPLSALSQEKLHAFVFDPDIAPRTRLGRFIDARTFVAWCLRRQLIEESPMASLERPIVDQKAPGIHTPDQVKEVMGQAWALDKPLARLLAVQYFAGLRPSEALRLVEKDLGLYVEVRSENAKSRKRRLVKVTENLRAWLALPGELPLSNVVKRLRLVRQAAKVPWPHDATRHSFASYHLAMHRDAAATAHELGHHDQQMLFAHYRELVTQEAAEAYWKIKPPGPTKPGGLIAHDGAPKREREERKLTGQ